MKKVLLVVLIITLSAAFAFAGSGPPDKDKRQFLTMGTGSPGGVYYPLGGGMAVIIEKTVEGLRCAAESTGA